MSLSATQATSAPAAAPVTTGAAALRPLPGESYEDFVVRAHGLLLPHLPEPEARNAAVWAAWEEVNGDQERERAARKFSSDRFELRPLVPLFVEHSKVGTAPDGSEAVTHYNVDELTRIIRENNFRIEDTDAYTGLVDKHTVPSGARDPMPPKTLGYVGPYRLGMIGRKEPRFAIFADEHHRKDRADVLSDRPRRSVEVLRLKANGRRYIDPIAALAEAPRLPLPVVHYSASAADPIAERYEAIAPEHVAGPSDHYALPAGGNTFVQGFNVKTKERHGAGAGDDMPHAGDTDSMVRQVVDAIMSTPEWQFLSEMQQAAKAGDPEAIGDQIPGAGPPAAGLPGAPEPGLPPGNEPPTQSPPPPGLAGTSVAGKMAEPGAAPADQVPGSAPVPEAVSEDAAPGAMPPGTPPAGPDAGPGSLLGDPEEPEQNMPIAAVGASLGARAGLGQAARTAAARGAGTAGKAARGAGAAAKSPGGQTTLAHTLGSLRGGNGQQPQGPAGPTLAQKIVTGPLPGNRAANSRFSAQYQGATRFSADSGGDPTMTDQATAADVERFAAIEAENDSLRTQIEQYQADNQRLSEELDQVSRHNESILTEQAEHYAALQHQVVQLTQDRTDSMRRERITALAQRFPQVNVEEECSVTLYSAGNDVSDENFEMRMDLIEKFAAEAAVASPMIPVGVDANQGPANQVETARFEAQAAETAREIVNEHLRRNERINYPDALAQAKERLAQAS